MFDRGNLFLIQSTHHQLPTQAPSGKSPLAALHEVHHTQYVHMGYWQAVG
jgi:hypothetical protein